MIKLKFRESAFANTFSNHQLDFENSTHPVDLFGMLAIAIEQQVVHYSRESISEDERVDEHSEVVERSATVSASYKNQNDFIFKGRSFFIFECFVMAFIRWAYSGIEGNEPAALRRMLGHAEEIVNSDPGAFFDTDFVFEIIGSDKDNTGINRLNVTISIDVENEPMYRDLPIMAWSESLNLYMV
jgi:hypothetical protein